MLIDYQNDIDIINSETITVPYNPQTLRFINMDKNFNSIGNGAGLVNYFYINKENDKVYQKIMGYIDINPININIPFTEESQIIKIDNKITLYLKNKIVE